MLGWAGGRGRRRGPGGRARYAGGVTDPTRTSGRPDDAGTWDDDLALALRLADAADAISAARFRSGDLHVSMKPDRTHVTDADQAVERAIRELVAAERPDDTFFGEEYGDDAAPSPGDDAAPSPDDVATRDPAPSGAAPARPGRQWIVDPIDGTANFLRGVPVWATLVALVVDGVPVVGVVSAPAMGRRWWASRGAGAWSSDRPGERLLVSGVSELGDASLSYNGLEYWREAGRLDQLLGLTEQVWRTRAYGEFWSYVMVAEGALDVAGEDGLAPYDMAALQVVVEEAGGAFSSLDGAPGPWHGSALATNGLLHDEVVRAVRRDGDALIAPIAPEERGPTAQEAGDPVAPGAPTA